MGQAANTARRRLQRIVDPFARDLRPAVADELVLTQWQRMYGYLPELSLAIALTTIAATFALLGELPWWQQFTPPALMLLGCGWLIFKFRRERGRVDVDHARRELRHAPRLAGAIGIVAGVWCVSAFTETEQYYCIVAPVFVALSVLMASNCLASVPLAATTAIVTSFSPIVVKMLMFDNLGIRCIAVMMIVIGAMQARLIYAKFDETVRTIELRHDLEALADTDALTGLDNRRRFDACLGERLAAAPEKVIVAMIDLDGFKPANDRFGHAAGDAVLVEVGRRLVQLFPESPSVARIGGDEFAVILPPGPTGHDAAKAVRAAIGLPFAIDPDVISITAGVGIARAPVDGRSVTDLMRAADRALYADKARKAARTRASSGVSA